VVCFSLTPKYKHLDVYYANKSMAQVCAAHSASSTCASTTSSSHQMLASVTRVTLCASETEAEPISAAVAPPGRHDGPAGYQTGVDVDDGSKK
jgi:hypothetical protein